WGYIPVQKSIPLLKDEMLLGQELKFKNKLCNLKLGTFFSALPGQRPGYNGDITKSPCKGKSFQIRSFCPYRAFCWLYV
ncbi:hypothetical protein V7T09_07560, partial [Segatella copri]|uniref:hypothetical protein n=1 Tax=Segatella copri TaxID=165179 RepID=UPI001C45B833